MSQTTNNISNLESKLQLLENYLNQLESQLIRAQRLASMGTMTAILAHEFNNILTPIVSYAKYALSRNDPELHRKALERAYHNGTEAAEICKQILKFARGEDVESECNIASVIHSTLKCLTRNPEKDNIKLILELDENLSAAIQPNLLQQVLYNLIINARNAMLGKGGTLKISAKRKNNYAYIQVSDTGKGIDPKIIDKIFDPFFSTQKTDNDNPSNRHGGSGLGLSVSKHIIEKSSGSIDVTSTLGKGTTFTIMLPIKRKQDNQND